ncbi:conjugative transfer system coupling protein TraD [Pseudoalteromonas rubra]|uniref:TraD/TraG TraM recognition site domain-containing protein n=1 Tax=Pseudoalteromonas rubra TaxID=43658 RepID=A0A0U3H4E6_9GAMM|nr:conjugative transfer system coupling protein TraD [Pseudoalteromonas rubra]ALU46147.1 hypothetical protein AT705_24605 [Pseudoalteromonas rubra]
MSTKYNRTDGRYIEHLFRPVYEAQTALAWLAGAMLTPFATLGGFNPLSWVTLGLMAVMGTGSLYYARKSLPLLRRQLRLKLNKREFMDVSTLRKINHLTPRVTKARWPDPKLNFLGYGFEWGSEHANRAYQVLDMDSTLSDITIPFFMQPRLKKWLRETAELGGKPYIHALGDETPVQAMEETFFGHTLVAGNIGTGKTTMLKLLSLNALHMGAGAEKKVLIIIDPKNDEDWKRAVRQEMAHLGMADQFYEVHPAKQSTSCRIPLLKNFVRTTEIADRIAPLMGSAGSSKSFEDFAYEQITFVASGMEYLGTPIRLTTIQSALSAGKLAFCEQVLHAYFRRTQGEDYAQRLDLEKQQAQGNAPWQVMAQYYKTQLANGPHSHQTIAGIIQLIEHPNEHFVKMITSLRPVLTALTTKPMDDLFSVVDDASNDDPRRVVDLDTLMEKGGCLYVSSDSMTDGKTSAFLARLMMAEIAAVSGRRYNKADTDAPRVCVFLDEAHAALENNNSLINLLAVGRASKIELYLATQTISDIEDKTSEATAKRVLGLCNNFISFRTTDPNTQTYVSEQFSKTSITRVSQQSGASISSDQSLASFRANHGETTRKQLEESFPKSLMGDLPKLQYIARLADGRKLKMRLPIVINKQPHELAPWIH